MQVFNSIFYFFKDAANHNLLSFCPRLSEIVTRTIMSPGLILMSVRACVRACVCLSVVLSRFFIIYSIESVLSYDSEFLAMGFFDIVLSFPNVS